MGSHPRPAFRPMSLSSPLGKGAPLLSRMVAPALRYQQDGAHFAAASSFLPALDLVIQKAAGLFQGNGDRHFEIGGIQSTSLESSVGIETP